ncbi:zinc-binding protein A33-like isoform X3 [Clupea harengus]|uniref:Zinc-binding protein A33-like isoform X3 n=1 Tax=Clupea harengus TaxID=7950 RepID=A0A6P8G8C8_CLUHA|nr:zinc-binding protein A33-like isoform X3 [Clupea harengus]
MMMLEKSLTSMMTETGTQRQEAPELMCPQHEEKLKLFCETDQQLVCLVCRDGISHEGHKFRPVEEMAQSCKGVLRGAVAFLSKENNSLDFKIIMQDCEIGKTKTESRKLSVQISAQFEQLHQLLRQKEQEVKTCLQQEEKRVLESMQKNLSKIKEIYTKERNKGGMLKSSLNSSQPITFL